MEKYDDLSSMRDVEMLGSCPQLEMLKGCWHRNVLKHLKESEKTDVGNVEDPVNEGKRVSYESGWQLTYYQEDKVMVPKLCAMAPWDTMCWTHKGIVGCFAFSKEAEQHLLESVPSASIKLFEPNLLINKWKCSFVSFGLGVPWKNYWDIKGTVN